MQSRRPVHTKGYVSKPTLGEEVLGAINLWVVIGALAVACVLTTVTVGLMRLGSGRGNEGVEPTAGLTIIPANLEGMETAQTPDATTTAAELPPPDAPSGTITIGAIVQIVETGGAGLRLREEPGLSNPVLLLGSEAEVFRVDKGPVEKDGYTWWYLVGPFDETRRGWGVANYLKIVQNP